MANERFHTSITSTARRYCQCNIEPSSIIVSENRVVCWAIHSEEMQAKNMKYIPFGNPVPIMSKTNSLWDKFKKDGFATPVEGSVNSHIWFERPYYRKSLWEEAMLLGNTGLVLSYLTLEDPE